MIEASCQVRCVQVQWLIEATIYENEALCRILLAAKNIFTIYKLLSCKKEL